MAIDEEKKIMAIKYNITIQCPMCKGMNDIEYIMGVKESFDCRKCGQKNNVIMSFLAMVDNPPGVRTMMVKAPEKRRLNTNVGGINISDRGTSKS